MNYDSTKAERVFRNGKCIGVLMPLLQTRASHSTGVCVRREYTTKHIPTSPTVPYLRLVTVSGKPC